MLDKPAGTWPGNWTSLQRILCRLLALCLLANAWLSIGCGLKRPPVPPTKADVPVLKRLEARQADGVVCLQWRLPTTDDRHTDPRIAGVRIYRSKTPLAEAPCQTCPLTFVRRKTILDADRLRYCEPLESGYRYHYKVKLLDARQKEGPDSPLVEAVCP